MTEVLLGKCVSCYPAEVALARFEMALQQAQANIDNPPDEAELAGYAAAYHELTSDGTRLLRRDGSGQPYADADEFVAVVCGDIRARAEAELKRVGRCAAGLREVLASCRGGTSSTEWVAGQPVDHIRCPVRAPLAELQAEI